MTRCHRQLLTAVTAAFACRLASAFGAGGDGPSNPAAPPIAAAAANPVAYWNEIATATINLPPSASGTPEERLPVYTADLATVHVAIYDAVMAIVGTHSLFATAPKADAAGASPEAAATEAAYRVLQGLFPNRSASYEAAHDGALAALPEGRAKTRGIALGAEVAAGVLARRADDGRSVALAPYVPGTAPGEYRGTNPINRMLPSIRPFALATNAQFRAPGPPSLTSAAYAADFEETRTLGSATSTVRSAEQTEIARFHTEPPFSFWPRNTRGFALTGGSLAEHARLMAMIWVTQADAADACFESKYHYRFWRPLSAIPLADTDGNDATTPDIAWIPVMPTPPHPEYPAGHSCLAGALAETLSLFYGKAGVAFDFTSLVTGSRTHHYGSTAALVSEIQIARIAGGMHFRTATVDGAALGKNVADWVLTQHFQPR